jgi:hypothetical protein
MLSAIRNRCPWFVGVSLLACVPLHDEGRVLAAAARKTGTGPAGMEVMRLA